MRDAWINHGVYPLLERIGDFQYYFAKVAVWIACICFLMTLLMAVVKIYLGVADAREQIIKMGVNLCLYLFFTFAYPIAMKAILPFAMNLGYGAVFGTSSAVTYDDKMTDLEDSGGTRAEFYKWIGENTGNIFSTTNTKQKDSEGSQAQVMLQMNIVDSKTGYLDLNKFLLYVLAFLRIGFNAIPTIRFWDIDLVLILACFFYFMAIIVAVFCMMICIMQYITCLIDYFALMGFGILTIPLSLWDGTKSYTEKLFGSIGSIMIKLIVISAFMSLAVFGIIDFFTDVYIAFKGMGLFVTPKEYFRLVELAITIVVRSFILYLLTQNTTSIAGFINGGSPAMSLGEAAIAAGSTVASAAAAGSMSKGVVNARGAAAEGALRAGASGIAAHNMGGSGIKSALASAGSSLARSASGGLSSIAQNAPGMLSNLASSTGLSRGRSAEGFATGKSGGGSGGGSSGGGKSGGGGSSAGGGGSSVEGGSTGGFSGGGGDSGFRNVDGSNIDSGGLDSAYGNAEKNETTGQYETSADRMIGEAGSTQGGTYLERKGAILKGVAGSVMKGVTEARKERDKGNVIGNSAAQGALRGFARGAHGAGANAINAGGGLKIRFKSGSEQASSKGYGSTKIRARVSNTDSRQINSQGQFAREKFKASKE